MAKYTKENLKKLTKDQMMEIIIKSEESYNKLLNEYRKAVPVVKYLWLDATIKDTTVVVTLNGKDRIIPIKSDKHKKFIEDQLKDGKLPVKTYQKAGYSQPALQISRA